MTYRWHEIARCVRAGEDLRDIADEIEAEDRISFARFLREELKRPDLADKHERRLRMLDLGIDRAQAVWHSISDAQRRVVAAVGRSNSGKIVRRFVKPSWYSVVGQFEPP